MLTLTLNRKRSRENKNARLVAAEAAVEQLQEQLRAREAELQAANNTIMNLRMQQVHVNTTQQPAVDLLKMRFEQHRNQRAQQGYETSGSPVATLMPPRHLEHQPMLEQQQLPAGFIWPLAPEVSPFPAAPQHEPGYVDPAELGNNVVQYSYWNDQ